LSLSSIPNDLAILPSLFHKQTLTLSTTELLYRPYLVNDKSFFKKSLTTSHISIKTTLVGVMTIVRMKQIIRTKQDNIQTTCNMILKNFSLHRTIMIPTATFTIAMIISRARNAVVLVLINPLKVSIWPLLRSYNVLCWWPNDLLTSFREVMADCNDCSTVPIYGLTDDNPSAIP